MPRLDQLLTNAVRQTPDPAAPFSGRYRTYGAGDAGDFALVPDNSSPTWAEILIATTVRLSGLATNGRLTSEQASGANRITLTVPSLNQSVAWPITGLTVTPDNVYSVAETYNFQVGSPVASGGSRNPSFPSNFDFVLDQTSGAVAVRTFWCKRMDLRPRDIVKLVTPKIEDTEVPTSVVEIEDTIFRVRFDPFWEIGVSSSFADTVEDGAWVVYGIARVAATGRNRYLDLFCRRQDATT